MTLSLICLGVCLCLILFSGKAKDGVLFSMMLCKDVLIPSMFPFLILSNFVALSEVSHVIGKLMKPICKHVFHLPESTGSAILLGLTCGYPTGVIMTERLLESGQIDKFTARRLLRFCFSSGLPFAVTAVGTVLLGSTKLGFIVWGSNTLSAVLIGFFDGLRHRKIKQEQSILWLSQPSGQAIVKSVKFSSSAMINVCAYVIIFGCFNGIIGNIGAVRDYALPLMEITNGVKNSIGIFSVPIIALYTGIGGICIHLQLQQSCIDIGMPFFEFFSYRVIQGILSAGLCHGLMWLFPIDADVFSNTVSVQREFFSVSGIATAMMIVMCIVLLFDIDNKRKVC